MKGVAKFGCTFFSVALIISTKTIAQQQPSKQPGTDTKIGNTFLLMDYQHRTAYILEDHDVERMKRMDGKKVVVTGTLDPLSNTIMVSTIRILG